MYELRYQFRYTRIESTSYRRWILFTRAAECVCVSNIYSRDINFIGTIPVLIMQYIILYLHAITHALTLQTAPCRCWDSPDATHDTFNPVEYGRRLKRPSTLSWWQSAVSPRPWRQLAFRPPRTPAVKCNLASLGRSYSADKNSLGRKALSINSFPQSHPWAYHAFDSCLRYS